jgi:hypothetical protein
VVVLTNEMATDGSLTHHLGWRSLFANAVVQSMQLVTCWQGGRQARPDCWPYASWLFPSAPSPQTGCEPRDDAWGEFSLRRGKDKLLDSLCCVAR